MSLSYEVYFRGKPACPCLAEWLPAYERELLRLGCIKHNIDIYQLIGGAAASAGTHSKGGAYDLAQVSDLAIKTARQMGAAAWHRPYNWDGRNGMEHHHGVLNGCPHNEPARYQIGEYEAGQNGLANHARDNGPRVMPLPTWHEGIAWAKAQERIAARQALPHRAAPIRTALKAVAAAIAGTKGKNKAAAQNAEKALKKAPRK